VATLGITSSFCSVYHPSGNCQAERTVWTVWKAIRLALNDRIALISLGGCSTGWNAFLTLVLHCHEHLAFFQCATTFVFWWIIAVIAVSYVYSLPETFLYGPVKMSHLSTRSRLSMLILQLPAFVILGAVKSYCELRDLVPCPQVSMVEPDVNYPPRCQSEQVLVEGVVSYSEDNTNNARDLNNYPSPPQDVLARDELVPKSPERTLRLKRSNKSYKGVPPLCYRCSWFRIYISACFRLIVRGWVVIWCDFCSSTTQCCYLPRVFYLASWLGARLFVCCVKQYVKSLCICWCEWIVYSVMLIFIHFG